MTDDTERITVGEAVENGEPMSMPVIDVLAGRGFITGKSGSGKSNTASVVAEQLLEAGYGLLIVDVDGEYYGLKEEYELLHAGANEECDIRVSPEHAGKLATLALRRTSPSSSTSPRTSIRRLQTRCCWLLPASSSPRRKNRRSRISCSSRSATSISPRAAG